MSLSIGTVLENRYRIDALLGQGGMGAVYRALHLGLNQFVAVKENSVASPVSIRQFTREARMMARLRHPNLPRVIDHFVLSDGAQYLVMEYIEGEDLGQILKRTGPLSKTRALAWIDQVCNALTYLHRQSPPIIHRDVKPGNIKITPQGQVFLVDFGIAKVGDVRTRTSTGALGVTPGFSPPEQYGAGRTDARSDVYALGATLYALLTGRVPPDSVQRLIKAATLVPPRQFRPDLSPAVASAVSAALSTTPTDRPQTIAAFRTLLAERPKPILPGAALPAPRPAASAPRRGEGTPHTPSRRRVPGWTLLTGGAVALLVCGLTAVVLSVALPSLLGTGPTSWGKPVPSPGPSDVLPTQEVPQPTPPPEDTPILGSQGATLEITNDSGADVWYVHFSPSEADRWGEDWLGDEVIEAGETYAITGIPEGVYDVRAQDYDEEQIETFWEVALEGNMNWTITGEAALEIVNESGDRIASLYISPTDSDTWGIDRLGDDVIDAGATSTVDGISRGSYDIKAEDADDNPVETVYNVPLSGEMSWTVTGKADLPSRAVLHGEDDFSDNRNNWGLDVETDDAVYMRPADGEYCILVKSSNFTAWEWYRPLRTDEFAAELSCYVEGAADAACGLGFGPDGDNLYWFEVTAYDQRYALFLQENGEWQDKLVEGTVSRDINPNAANYMSVERVRGVMSLFVNGVLVGRVDSDRFPTGRVGIGGATYEEGYGTICMDDLRVWRLE